VDPGEDVGRGEGGARVADVARHVVLGRRALVGALGMFAVVAVLAGLARVGVVTRVGGATAGSHGPLFVVGVFGSLIALERAVALASPWGYAAPALGLVFVAALLGAVPLAPYVGVAACVGQVALNVAVLRRQAAVFTWLMTGASVALAVGAAAWAVTRSLDTAIPSWLVYFVATIAAERLELSRLAPPSPRANTALVVLVGLAILASSSSWLERGESSRVTGACLSLVGAWQLRYDVARRTLFLPGLPRYAAVGILAGAAWLLVGGALLCASGLPAGGGARDAVLHTLFVGHVLSMVLAHAPIVLPAVAKVTFRYRPALFGPLALLHATLVLRVVGDLAGVAALRTWGTIGNVTALGAFVVTVLVSSVTRPRSRARQV
jgi:hypothetical protein